MLFEKGCIWTQVGHIFQTVNATGYCSGRYNGEQQFGQADQVLQVKAFICGMNFVHARGDDGGGQAEAVQDVGVTAAPGNLKCQFTAQIHAGLFDSCQYRIGQFKAHGRVFELDVYFHRWRERRWTGTS